MLAKARRSIAQLGPKEYDKFQWRAFSSPLRCLQCLGPLVLILLCEARPPQPGRHQPHQLLGLLMASGVHPAPPCAACCAWGPWRSSCRARCAPCAAEPAEG